jgi:hypothetical protein
VDDEVCPNCGADVRGTKRATETQRETRVEPSIEREATDGGAGADDAPRH